MWERSRSWLRSPGFPRAAPVLPATARPAPPIANPRGSRGPPRSQACDELVAFSARAVRDRNASASITSTASASLRGSMARFPTPAMAFRRIFLSLGFPRRAHVHAAREKVWTRATLHDARRPEFPAWGARNAGRVHCAHTPLDPFALHAKSCCDSSTWRLIWFCRLSVGRRRCYPRSCWER